LTSALSQLATHAWSGFGSKLSVVQRDVDVSVPGDAGYVRKTC
jgi:hypothetical protein